MENKKLEKYDIKNLESIYEILDKISKRPNHETTKKEISKVYENASTIGILRVIDTSKISKLIILASSYIADPIIDGNSEYGSESEAFSDLVYIFCDTFDKFLGKKIQ